MLAGCSPNGELGARVTRSRRTAPTSRTAPPGNAPGRSRHSPAKVGRQKLQEGIVQIELSQAEQLGEAFGEPGDTWEM